MVNIADILEIPSLKRLRILAGHGGLNRQVSTVSVMDAPDIYEWMKGGEFLITSGNPIKEDPDYLATLIEKLDKHGASAFGIKTERFIGMIPQEAIDAADRLNFPLIYIPMDFAFTDIINPVLEEVISKQAIQLKFSQKIHQSFTELALTEQPIEKLLECLQAIIHREVAFFDMQFIKLFISPKSQGLMKELPEKFLIRDFYSWIESHYDTHKISNQRTTYGIIILGKDNKTINVENQHIALESAGTNLILDMQKRISNDQITSRFRDEFIFDIVYNNINSKAEFYNRAELYHWKIQNGGRVVIVDFDNFKEHYAQKDTNRNLSMEFTMQVYFRSITRRFKEEFEQVAYSKLNDYFIYIIYEECDMLTFQKRLEKVYENFRGEIIEKLGLTATIAAGQYKEDVMDLHKSFEEAKKCIRIHQNMNRGDVVILYEKIGIYKLIYLILGTEEAAELLENYIYTLKRYDEKNNGDLLETLIIICENSWNLKLASKELFLHYNTIKYRFGRICQILQSDFKNMDDRLNAEVAIRIYQMTK